MSYNDSQHTPYTTKPALIGSPRIKAGFWYTNVA